MLRGSLGLGLCLCVTVGCSSGDEFESRRGDGGSGKGGSSAGGSSSGSGGSSGTAGSSGAGGRDAGSGGSAGTSKGGGGGSAGSGGKQGSGGSIGGGAGGAAGSSGGGMGGGTSGGGGTGGQMPCTWGMSNNCPAGSFCNALGCGAGACMAIPNEGSTRSPVCGCDGLTYWNASVAAHRGMSVKSVGECAVGTTCGGFGSIECPGIAYCNYFGADSTLCAVSDLGGSCWVMPAVCPPPGIGFGPQTRACGDPLCAYECALIKREEPFYDDSNCPQ